MIFYDTMIHSIICGVCFLLIFLPPPCATNNMFDMGSLHTEKRHTNCRCYITDDQLESVFSGSTIERVDKISMNNLLFRSLSPDEYILSSDPDHIMHQTNNTHPRRPCSNGQYDKCIRLFKLQRDNKVGLDVHNRMTIHPNQTMTILRLLETTESTGFMFTKGLHQLSGVFSKNYSMCDNLETMKASGAHAIFLCSIRSYLNNTFYQELLRDYKNDISLWINSTHTNVLHVFDDHLEHIRMKINITGLNRTEIEQIHRIRKNRRKNQRPVYRGGEIHHGSSSDDPYGIGANHHRWTYITNNPVYDEMFSKIHNETISVEDYIESRTFKATIRKFYDYVRDPDFKYHEKKTRILNALRDIRAIVSHSSFIEVTKKKMHHAYESTKDFLWNNRIMKRLRERDHSDAILRLNTALVRSMDYMVGRKHHHNMINNQKKREYRSHHTGETKFLLAKQKTSQSHEYENIGDRKRATQQRLDRFMKNLVSTDYKYSKRHFLSHLFHKNGIGDVIDIMKYMNTYRRVDKKGHNSTIHDIIINSHKNYTDIPSEHQEILKDISAALSSLSPNVINRYESLDDEKRKLIDTLWNNYREHIIQRATREKRRNNSPYGEKVSNWTGFDDPSPYVVNDLPDLLPFVGFIGSWILRLDNSFNSTGCNPGFPLLPEQSATCFYPIFVVTNFTVGPPGFDFFNPQCESYINPLVYGQSFVLTFGTVIFGPLLQEYPGWGLTGPFAPFPFGYFVWNATGGIGFNALPPNTIPCLYVYQLWTIVYSVIIATLMSIFVIAVYVWQRIQEKLFIKPLVGRTRVVIGRFKELGAQLSSRAKAGASKGLESLGAIRDDVRSSLDKQRGKGGSKLKSPFGKGGFKLPKTKLPTVKIPKIPIKLR